MKYAGIVLVLGFTLAFASGCVMSAADRAELQETTARLAGERAAQEAERLVKAAIDRAVKEAEKRAAKVGLSSEETQKLIDAARAKAEEIGRKIVADAKAEAEAFGRATATRATKEAEDGKTNAWGRIALTIASILTAGGALAAKGGQP